MDGVWGKEALGLIKACEVTLSELEGRVCVCAAEHVVDRLGLILFRAAVMQENYIFYFGILVSERESMKPRRENSCAISDPWNNTTIV